MTWKRRSAGRADSRTREKCPGRARHACIEGMTARILSSRRTTSTPATETATMSRNTKAKLVVTAIRDGGVEVQVGVLSYGPRNFIRAAKLHEKDRSSRVLLVTGSETTDVTIPVCVARDYNRWSGASMKSLWWTSTPESLVAHAAEYVRVKAGGLTPHFYRV